MIRFFKRNSLKIFLAALGLLLGVVPYVKALSDTFLMLYLLAFGLFVIVAISSVIIAFVILIDRTTKLFNWLALIAVFSFAFITPACITRCNMWYKNQVLLNKADKITLALNDFKDSTGVYPKKLHEVFDSSTVDGFWYTVDSTRQSFKIDYSNSNGIYLIYLDEKWH